MSSLRAEYKTALLTVVAAVAVSAVVVDDDGDAATVVAATGAVNVDALFYYTVACCEKCANTCANKSLIICLSLSCGPLHSVLMMYSYVVRVPSST